MRVLTPLPPDSFQAQFHQRWNHLNDPHVRALAWLLDAPDLLDLHAPQWQGRIASLTNNGAHFHPDWLAALDLAPAELHAALDAQPFTRLGRYAEKLMAFYFQHQGNLVAYGLQVQAGKNATIGEFDFLLRDQGALVHWEFATKFYLLESTSDRPGEGVFVGPNLADTLSAKMHKILDKQLALSSHPAALSYLPQAVDRAQALIKGWLFYHKDTQLPEFSMGLASAHCRGFWCTLAEWDGAAEARYAILPRLQWLAPAKIALDQALYPTLDTQEMAAALKARFEQGSMPVLVAALAQQGDFWLETMRGFIVPDDWRNRAGQFIQLID